MLDDGEARLLAGGRVIEQAGKARLKGAQARISRGDAQREAHGRIAQHDRQAVAQAAQIPGFVFPLHMEPLLRDFDVLKYIINLLAAFVYTKCQKLVTEFSVAYCL